MLPRTNKRNGNIRFALLVLVILTIIATVGLVDVRVMAASPSESGSTSTPGSGHNPLSSNRWTSNGPDGGQVISLAVDPTNSATIYAVAATGIFKSTNRGESWIGILMAQGLRMIAIAPSKPTTIYAGGHGMYRSTNGGASWEVIDNGIVNQDGPIYVTALAIDPTNATVVYTAGADVEVGGTYKAIYKSTDGGNSWNITKHSLNAYAVHHALAVDPANPNTIYAAGAIGAAGTFWRSDDGGRFWEIFYLGYDSSYI